ncbi:MAG: lactate utilization protein [Fusobacteriota bacterium]
MNNQKKYYRNLSKIVIKGLKKRNMDGIYFDTKEEARDYILDNFQKDKTISWGGSMTLDDMGVIEALDKGDYNLIDKRKATSEEEKEKIYHKALSSDYYLMSSNAITRDGKLVNIDGRGNRVASLIYGPKKIIMPISMNKVRDNELSARERVQNIASPINTVRLSQETPCSKTGYCQNCQVDDTICCQIVITRRSREKGRIKVILIGEKLGF